MKQEEKSCNTGDTSTGETSKGPSAKDRLAAMVATVDKNDGESKAVHGGRGKGKGKSVES